MRDYCAKIYPIEGEPFVVRRFMRTPAPRRLIKEKETVYFNFRWGGGILNASFDNLDSIDFLDPGNTRDVEIAFRDGQKDTARLIASNPNVCGYWTFGTWEGSLDRIRRISFMHDEGKAPDKGSKAV